MAKTMKSFRLDTESAMILEAHANSLGFSQAELIEQMLVFMSEAGVFSALELIQEENGYISKNWAWKATQAGRAWDAVKPIVYDMNRAG